MLIDISRFYIFVFFLFKNMYKLMFDEIYQAYSFARTSKSAGVKHQQVIMEYLVKISKKTRILELKRRHLKITVLISYTPYPSRKIRRICACTSQETTKIQSPIRYLDGVDLGSKPNHDKDIEKNDKKRKRKALSKPRKMFAKCWKYFDQKFEPNENGEITKMAYCKWCPAVYKADSVKNGTSNMNKHYVNCDKNPENEELFDFRSPTRWNSIHDMLKTAIELKDAFFDYDFHNSCFARDLEEIPKRADFEVCKKVVAFLEKFKETTELVSSVSSPVAHLWFGEILDIDKHLHEWQENASFTGMISKMRPKYDKYWGDYKKINHYMYFAVILDPTMKSEIIGYGFRHLIKNGCIPMEVDEGSEETPIPFLTNEELSEKLVKKVEKDMRVLFAMYKEKYGSDVSSDMPKSTASQTSNTSHCRGNAFLNSFKDKIGNKLSGGKDELTKYLKEPRLELEDDKDFDILNWWKLNSPRFSIVSRMTKDIFFQSKYPPLLPNPPLARVGAFDLVITQPRGAFGCRKTPRDPTKKCHLLAHGFRKIISYDISKEKPMSNKELESKVEDMVEEVKTKMGELFGTYKERFDFLSSNSSMGEHMESEVTSPNNGDNDFLNDYYNVDATSSYETETELDRYLREPKIELRKGQSLDILQWWKVNGPRFPIVSKMARDILAIQISTVASEAAFSTGGRVLDPYRTRLSTTIVEALICTQDWVRKSRTQINWDDVEDLIKDDEIVKDMEEQLEKLTEIDKAKQTGEI
ncbi:zinc finger BED domain-containing protein RICESLEEPER 2 [Tanacetum coccineum]